MKHFMRMSLLIVLVLLWANVAPAAVRTFAWDQNTEPVEHYRMYRAVAPDVQVEPGGLWLKAYPPGQNPDPGDLANIEFTINAEGAVEVSRNMLPDGSYYLVVTAVSSEGQESGKSNEIYTIIYDNAFLGKWEFNWTPVTVPDLAGYRLYIIQDGVAAMIGHGQHFWQGAADVALPLVLDIPVGNWDSYLTSFDMSDRESAPTFNCDILLADEFPPTPAGYMCYPGT
jgi:hypothetical protein